MKIQLADQRPATGKTGTHGENAKLTCSEISAFQNSEIEMQQKYNV